MRLLILVQHEAYRRIQFSRCSKVNLINLDLVKEIKMDFIERFLHMSPDGGNGSSEFMIAILIFATVISLIAALRNYLPKNFVEYLEQLGKKEGSDRFDN
jgi:hypothetical protein